MINQLIASTVPVLPKWFIRFFSGPYVAGETIENALTHVKRINNILLKDSSNKAANRIVDKQIYNFIYIGFIKMILPKAKIIHIERNPLDTCLSIYTLKFVGHHAYAYSLKDLGNYYNLYKNERF